MLMALENVVIYLDLAFTIIGSMFIGIFTHDLIGKLSRGIKLTKYDAVSIGEVVVWAALITYYVIKIVGRI